MRTRRPLIWCVPLIAGLASSLHGQVPDIGDPPAAPLLRPSLRNRVAGNAPPSAAPPSAGWYDTSTRTAVRDSWNLTFWPTITVPTGWTGNVASNIPGATTQAFKDAVAARINWFRAMAGVPPQIAISPVYSGKDQQAALMFSANRQISHSPPSNWLDYSAEAAEAAANSNICYGFFNDPGCVAAYIIDWGSNNAEVGHRRWILYPQTMTMGTGDVPQSGPAANPYPPANALWVFDGLYGTARPATRAAYVAWPPPGFVPYQVVGFRDGHSPIRGPILRMPRFRCRGTARRFRFVRNRWSLAMAKTRLSGYRTIWTPRRTLNQPLRRRTPRQPSR